MPTEQTQFQPGQSGNPGGRPKGLARLTREKVGGEGDQIITFWIETMNDTTCSRKERLEASKLLAERGWGKPAGFQLIEDTDPLETNHQELNAAVERFGAEVVRLSAVRGSGTPDPGDGPAVEPQPV